jgi:hypothetical protein
MFSLTTAPSPREAYLRPPNPKAFARQYAVRAVIICWVASAHTASVVLAFVISVVTGPAPLFGVLCKPSEFAQVLPFGSSSQPTQVWLAASLVEAALVNFWVEECLDFDSSFERSSVAWSGHTAMRLL